tara:strand:- start:252 stop:494 length:243 start_codon:yes stop_codon:yes gene_type:complete
MGSFSIWHWLIVLLVVVLVFGTKKLKNMGSDIGGAVRGFKDGLKDGSSAGSSVEKKLEESVPVSKKNPDTSINVSAKDKS